MDTGEIARLPARAESAASKAYAPYSGFRVGAALLTEAGAVQIGCNVENSAFPVGGCAERHAIAAAVACEGPAMRIAAIAVIALDPTGAPVACAPCGACRQAILEFGPSARVVFRADTGSDFPALATVSAETLLPGAFTFSPA
jgi:cytidine deaminase